MRAETKRQSVALVWPKLGTYIHAEQLKFFPPLLMSVNDCESAVEFRLGGYKYILVSRPIHKYGICKERNNCIPRSQKYSCVP